MSDLNVKSNAQRCVRRLGRRLIPWDRRHAQQQLSSHHAQPNKRPHTWRVQNLITLSRDLRCGFKGSTHVKHRTQTSGNRLNEMHPHLAPPKQSEAIKVLTSATFGRCYYESFYVLPPHLLPVCILRACPRVIVHRLICLDRQRGDGDQMRTRACDLTLDQC